MTKLFRLIYVEDDQEEVVSVHTSREAALQKKKEAEQDRGCDGRFFIEEVVVGT